MHELRDQDAVRHYGSLYNWLSSALRLPFLALDAVVSSSGRPSCSADRQRELDHGAWREEAWTAFSVLSDALTLRTTSSV